MNTNSEISEANDTGDWGNNKEMNPMANSSVTENPMLEDENTKDAGDSWRNDRDAKSVTSSGAAAQKARDTDVTGDPGRTPGKAEGVEDSEIEGNE
jgi:hypothetical protein